MKDKQEDIVKSVEEDMGFELFRHLIRRYDPINPGLKVQLQARILMIDHKCKNSKDVVDRLTLLNRLVNHMREQCGEVPTSDMLATVLHANMDPNLHW